MERIAIIGAGMAGLSAAAALHAAGHRPVVFEKSPAIGGRIATRHYGLHRFDHGAQFARARDPEFAAYLAQATAQGAAQAWEVGGRRAHIGRPAMRDLLMPLADGLDIRFEEELLSLTHTGRTWNLGFATRSYVADAVVLTPPAPQSGALLKHAAPGIAQELARVRFAPCWALMLSGDRLDELPSAHFFAEDATIVLATRASSRQLDPTDPTDWVLQASPEWSAERAKLSPEAAAVALLDHLGTRLGRRPEATFSAAKFWRYAMVEEALDTPFLSDPSRKLFVGGDGCLGPRIEAAWISGRAIADALADLS